MKIIFLDIDGVLSNAQTIKFRNKIDIDSVRLLKEICNETNAQLVLTSPWRLFNDTLDLIDLILKENQMELFGSTPSLRFNDSSYSRGKEIGLWLKKHKKLDIEKFVILDDDNDMGDLIDHLVQTTYEAGLTREIADKVIEILNESEFEQVSL